MVEFQGRTEQETAEKCFLHDCQCYVPKQATLTGAIRRAVSAPLGRRESTMTAEGTRVLWLRAVFHFPI